MMKSILLLTAAPLLTAAESGYDAVSEGLTFESSPVEELDRHRILAEIHGGVPQERKEGGRPIARRLRRVKKVNLGAKEEGRDLNASVVSFCRATVADYDAELLCFVISAAAMMARPEPPAHHMLSAGFAPLTICPPPTHYTTAPTN